MYKILFFLVVISFCNVSGQTNKDWKTDFEKSGYLNSSDYKTTIEYFQNLEKASSYAKLINIGLSAQGRVLYCLVVTKDQKFNPLNINKKNKPLVMILNGIHPGEIEGKDASLLLLREILITKERQSILDNVNLLVIPVFNADGHERRSKYNRINQNGPVEMGWRATAQNYNLNRDFTKADSPEMRSILSVISAWLPDIFIDTHTTDGMDFQYTISYATSKYEFLAPKTSFWINKKLNKFIENYVDSSGYLIKQYSGQAGNNINDGLVDYYFSPRFSHSYVSMQNKIGILIETHMLKPYKERVYSTKALIESILKFCSSHPNEIKTITAETENYVVKEFAQNKRPFPITFSRTREFTEIDFKGYKSEMKFSRIAGDSVKYYTKEKFKKNIPFYNKFKIDKTITPPQAYLIPKEWSSIVYLLHLHGIKYSIIHKPIKAIIERYKFHDISFNNYPYESRFIPKYKYDVILDTINIQTGGYKVSTNQKNISLILNLFEPLGPDSFMKWGFFNQIFERKEYFEKYSFEPIAERMIKKDSILLKKFNNKILESKGFKNSVNRRYNFFYERSKYFDKKLNVYPIVRIIDFL